MVKIANIACKTIGIAGMSVVLYDAYAHAKHHAAVGKIEYANDTYEKAIAAERSNTNASHVTGAVQKKIANLRMNNPIIPFIGKVKGGIEGFLSSLGDSIIPVALSSIALATKGTFQKIGAWGLGIYAVAKILKEGFGVGKTTPIDE